MITGTAIAVRVPLTIDHPAPAGAEDGSHAGAARR
jgi:hypothetical protein